MTLFLTWQHIIAPDSKETNSTEISQGWEHTLQQRGAAAGTIPQKSCRTQKSIFLRKAVTAGRERRENSHEQPGQSSAQATQSSEGAVPTWHLPVPSGCSSDGQGWEDNHDGSFPQKGQHTAKRRLRVKITHFILLRVLQESEQRLDLMVVEVFFNLNDSMSSYRIFQRGKKCAIKM